MCSRSLLSSTFGVIILKWRASLVFVAVVSVLCWANPTSRPRSLLDDDLRGGVRGFFHPVTKFLPGKGKTSWTLSKSTLDVWPGSRADAEEYVAICIAVRNQHEDMKEWLLHHYYHLGIRRFYILDDGSSPALDSYEDYPIPRSAMTFRYYTQELRESYQQRRIYDDCNAKFGTKHRWIGYIDADEYLEIVEASGTSLASFLRDYEDYGAFGVQWIIHNSNGNMQRAESTRRAYTSCIGDGPAPDGAEPDNRHIKSFVQTKYYEGMESPHNFFLNDSKFTVGENEDRMTYAWRTPITRDKIALHHYAVKSKAEFAEKIQRGNAASDPKGWSFWERVEGYEKVDCRSLAKYRP